MIQFNDTYLEQEAKNVLLNIQNGNILMMERGDKFETVSERTISFKD